MLRVTNRITWWMGVAGFMMLGPAAGQAVAAPIFWTNVGPYLAHPGTAIRGVGAGGWLGINPPSWRPTPSTPAVASHDSLPGAEAVVLDGPCPLNVWCPERDGLVRRTLADLHRVDPVFEEPLGVVESALTVPEPATLLLFGVGLSVAATWRRRSAP